MQSYWMITLLSIMRELESPRYIFLDYIDASEDENADIINSKNLEHAGRHAFQQHVR
jgi:hypothetical protein